MPGMAAAAAGGAMAGTAMSQQGQVAMMPCPGCGGGVPVGSKFCANCGAKIEVPQQPPPQAAAAHCPSCGSPVPPGGRFCASCGNPLP